MKKILYPFAALIMMFQISCGDFLKETSGDLLIPKNVTDFAGLLYGEAYPKSLHTASAYITLMTDDVDMGPTKGSWPGYDNLTGGDGLWAYRWDIDVEEKLIDEAWSTAYQYILGCNTIIQSLPTMKYDPADVDLYNSVAAAAYALRSYYYFSLVNWYAAPYSTSNLSKDGVVILTSANVSLDLRQRSTIGEIYELINNDIAKAKEHTKKGRANPNKFLINAASIEFLSNRIALFQEKWDDVINEGEKFIKTNGKLFSLKSVDKAKMGANTTPFTMLTLNNPEVLFSFGSSSSYPYKYISWSSLYGIGFKVNSDGQNSLINSYEENDLRKIAYYKVDYTDKWGDQIFCNHYPLKYISSTENGGYMVNWRNVEVYLNMAEAYARKETGVSARAIELLNTIRENRFDATYKPLAQSDFRSKDELVQFVWEERRRELSFEETMRFWDIRRQGCKSITHVYYANLESYTTYIIPENSPNFVIQIPASEYGPNSIIRSNDREVISPK